ncbi:helix-turn-helix domain-containing protein [Draconibacterium orientale]|uniref:helix-turn-helix transcriptional regulator n=1 Tax=Draconibacterium orientale TaxID=1168034 RepID=UPI0029C01AE7|nr:helix-turn-helix domain-containing protein [Draconibacterium orientale]
MENETILSKKVLSELRQIKNLLFENKTVLNVEELAQYTGLSKSKIYKLLSQKLIPTGNNANIRQKFFYKKDIDLWLMGTSKEELELEDEFNKMLSENRKK